MTSASVHGSAGSLADRLAKRIRRRINAGCVTILAYHSVSPRCTMFNRRPAARHEPEEFERQMDYLLAHRKPMRLSEVVEKLNGREEMDSAAVVTIDDGLADAATYALPILHRRRIPVTLFPVTSVIGNGDLLWQHKLAWLLEHGREEHLRGAMAASGIEGAGVNESMNAYVRRVYFAGLPELLEEEVRACGVSGSRLAGIHKPYLSAEFLGGLEGELVEIGNHTHTHAVMAALTAEAQRVELSRAAAEIERITGRRPTAAAYPFGLKAHYTEESVDAVRETGHSAALDMRRRVNMPGTDPMQLSRKPSPSGSMSTFERVVEDWTMNGGGGAMEGRPW